MASKNALDTLLKSLTKDLGASGKLSLMSDATCNLDPTIWICTGISLLDGIIGGGIPIGRMVEIFGQWVTGKTLLALQIMAHAQQQDILPVYIDTEKGASSAFAGGMGGLDLSRVGYGKAKTVEDTFIRIEEIMEKTRKMDEDTPVLFVVDSLAALPTRKELAAQYGEPIALGEAQRIYSHAMRKVTQWLDEQKAAIIFTNQQYTNIGAAPWEDKFLTYGGKALKYHCSTRLMLKATGRIKEGDEEVGVKIRVTVIKNRFDPPGKTVEFPIRYATGVNDTESVVKFLYGKGHFGDKKGWLNYQGDKFREKDFVRMVEESPALKADLVLVATKQYIKPTEADAEDEDDGVVVAGVEDEK